MIAHADLPAPRFADALSAELVPSVLLLAVGALYLVGARRARAPIPRRVAFVGGLVVAWVALASPVERYAGALLSIHMAQHLLVMMLAAPLLIAGTPLRVARHAWRPGGRALARALRRPPLRHLAAPLTGWLAWAAVLWGTHFSGIYQASLEHDAVHHLEHAAYLAAALAFWMPVLAAEPTPRPLSPPLRLLYVFLAGPQTALLGAAIIGSQRVLYPHYAAAPAWAPEPLADQATAGAMMWITGGLGMVVATLLVAGAWARREGARDPLGPIGPPPAYR